MSAITIEIRPEVMNALDAMCTQTGNCREGVVLDLIEAALGLPPSEFVSMTPAGDGYQPVIAEARLGAPGGR